MKHLTKSMPSGSLSTAIVTACALLVCAWTRGGDLSTAAPGVPPGPVGYLVHTNYHGWTNAILVSNGRVEAVIVPEIARIMQFRFAGEEDGPFWENRELYGSMAVSELHKPSPMRLGEPAAETPSNEWSNLGGDWVWPAPQSTWPRHLQREWPPPRAFDSLSWDAEVDGFTVTLVSPVDSEVGIRVRRRIELALEAPVMRVTTTFEKSSGRAMDLGIWAVTALKDPESLIVPLPQFERFPDGYLRRSTEPPPDIEVKEGLLVLGRDPKAPHKVGTDANEVFWLGKETALRIASPRHLYARYPDEGCSLEIHTSPDPEASVRVEILGPLQKLTAGGRISRSSTYTLFRRSEIDPELEVRMLLSR